MNALIQDLLEVTRIETGNLRLSPREERVGPLLVEEALAMLRPLAGARGISLEKEVAPGLPPVSMDTARVLQVISLVGNAIKFTPQGGRIVLRCEEGEVRFALADNGPGISPEQLPHVFGRFWQASSSDRRGIGPGLSIARGIVEGHRGRIWVESAPGRGRPSTSRSGRRCWAGEPEGSPACRQRLAKVLGVISRMNIIPSITSGQRASLRA